MVSARQRRSASCFLVKVANITAWPARSMLINPCFASTWIAAFQRYSTVDLKALLFDDEDTRDIDQTQFTQPALFCVEYSLARTLIDLGITPDSMIGHSLGEYVAACIAGVFTLEDALHVIEARGRLMQSMRPGSMMAVYLSREQLTPWLAAERVLNWQLIIARIFA